MEHPVSNEKGTLVPLLRSERVGLSVDQIHRNLSNGENYNLCCLCWAPGWSSKELMETGSRGCKAPFSRQCFSCRSCLCTKWFDLSRYFLLFLSRWIWVGRSCVGATWSCLTQRNQFSTPKKSSPWYWPPCGSNRKKSMKSGLDECKG